ncbi:MAG: hypothetical protein GEU28_07115 [Dehalococcoidia bacterium]|nr:hypothetical protein [Dehalococcoidia bacterium]
MMAYDGVTILDFTAYQLGPLGTMLLADLGANVIKVEPPRGEMGRRIFTDETGFSGFFESLNRGKKSIVLDLKEEADRERALRLVEKVDVVTENFASGTMDAFGLGYEAVSERNPRIVYVSATGFGPRGPLASAPGFDATAQAFSGLMDAQSAGPEAPPSPMLYGLADSVGGLMFSHAVSIGLLSRERSGRGMKIDVSLIGSLLFIQSPNVVETLSIGRQPYMKMRLFPTFGPYLCADGKWLMLASVNPKEWKAICQAIEREDLFEDAEMASSRWRSAHGDQVEPLLEEAFAGRDREHWLELLTEGDVPCAPVLEYVDLPGQEQILANAYLTQVEHREKGPVHVVPAPFTFSEPREHTFEPAPQLGADTETILEWASE